MGGEVDRRYLSSSDCAYDLLSVHMNFLMDGSVVHYWKARPRYHCSVEPKSNLHYHQKRSLKQKPEEERSGIVRHRGNLELSSE